MKYIIFLTYFPFSTSFEYSGSNLFITKSETKIITKSTILIAEPKFQFPVTLNCCSIIFPIKFSLFQPKSADISKVEIDGINTIVIPVITPGKLIGNTNLVNVLILFAPKS